jgi:ribonuclease HI
MIEVYIDGSCAGNPGKGGWACIILEAESFEHSGSVPNTTNNRMELLSAINAIKLTGINSLKLISDSNYVILGMTKWIKNWKARGWKKSNGEEVMNKDLWIELDELCSSRVVEFQWVKGHSVNEYNKRCDELAKSQSLS